MKKEAILHIPLSQYAYATGEKDITISCVQQREICAAVSFIMETG